MARTPETRPHPARPPGTGLAFLVLAVAVLLVFGRACTFDFVTLDDWDNIVENPCLNPPSAGSVAYLWGRGYEALYIPVTYTFWALEAAMFRREGGPEGASALWPGGFHAVNLLLHLANAWLVFGLVLRFLRRGAPPANAARDPRLVPATLGALLFALHPVQVEPVVWVTGTKDMLSTFLSLLALHTALRYVSWSDAGDRPAAQGAPAARSPRDKPELREGGRAGVPAGSCPAQPGKSPARGTVRLEPRSALFLAGTLAYAMALLSKPSAVAVPGLVLLLAWLVEGRPPLRTARVWGGWALLTLPLILCNKALQEGDASAWTAPVAQRPWIALDTLGFYAVKLVAPLGLGVDYGRTPRAVLDAGDLRFVGVALLVVVLAGVAARRTLVPVAALGLAVAALLPVLGLVPFGFQEYSTVADRYMYVAMLGPALGLAAAVVRRPGTWLGWVVALSLLACAARSGAQVGIWRDSRTLFAGSLAVNPQSAWLRNGLAHTMMQEGRDVEAIDVLNEALRLKPGYVDALANLGIAKGKLGRLEEAVAHFRQASGTYPHRADVRHNLGMALARLERTEEAIAELQLALKLDPGMAAAHDELGIIEARRGDLEAAARHFAEALRISPGNKSARAHLERALRQLGAQGGPLTVPPR